MTFNNKFILSLLLSLFLNFNLFAQDINDFIGKKLIVNWTEKSCEFNFYDWKEVSANCYTDKNNDIYNLNLITQDDGLKYFKWGPVERDKNRSSFFHGITFFNDESFAVLFKEDAPNAQWAISNPEYEIAEIDYDGENIIKKNIFDFQISLLDTLIFLEINSETSNNTEIEKFQYCKKNLPRDLITNTEEYKKVNFNEINNDLEIFTKVSLTDEGEESFDKWLEKAMSGSEEPNTLPEGFNEISSVDNFLAIFGGMFAYAFGCEMFN